MDKDFVSKIGDDLVKGWKAFMWRIILELVD